MLKMLDGLIDRLFVAAGAILLAQAPAFFVAYNQRMGGHLSELQLQINSMQKAAEISGKELPEYIGKFVAHSDVDVAFQGELMQGMLDRYAQLTTAYQALFDATPFTRPFMFLRHLQLDIAQKTWADFQFGINFTLETGLYALIGMGAGYFLYFGVRKLVFAFTHNISKLLATK